jgi:hypothetical protein|tara:strand:+ start:207 stop:632 length:426 start_codon:yes stop_codon:yes gene_type:complete
MKKDSSFKLKSGNDLGRSAAKLMKQSPARAEDKGPNEGVKTPSHTPQSLKAKLEKAISSGQEKLESRIKGFFGNIQKGFKTAAEKRASASEKRTKKIAEQKAKFTAGKKKFEEKVKKVISKKPERKANFGSMFSPHMRKNK